MPRDRDNDSSRGRPPGRGGPPSRGSGPRTGGKPGGGGFRGGRGAEGGGDKRRSSAPGSKRFDDRKPGGGRSFGDKKPYGDRKPAGDKRAFAGKPGGFRKDGDRPPRRDFNRDGDARPARSREDRPARDSFRSERPAREFRPRDDRGGGDSRPARSGPPRGSFRSDGDRPPRREFNRDGDRPRSGGFKRDDRPAGFKRGEGRSEGSSGRDFGKREYKPREDRGGDKPWASRPPRGDGPPRDRPRSDGPRSYGARSSGSRDGGDRGERKFDRPRSDRPRTDRPYGDRPARSGDGERRFDRPRSDRPKFDRAGGDRPFGGRGRDDARGERPRGERKSFLRDRDERPNDETERPVRPRPGYVSRDRSVWRDHSANEAADGETRVFEPRPAFGGRGEYRERSDRDTRRRDDEAPKAKKSGERIAKLMARAGLCSRRDAEEWIKQGRVAVNGRVINSPALDIMPSDAVTIDGAPMPERERTRMFLYHKPKGLVTTHSDPEGRPTVFESLPGDLPRLISIGRLDYNTEGLLLLTNDGGLARTLELPDTGWLRRYRVRAHGSITQERLNELRKGVEVDGVKYGSIEATLEHDQGGANVWIVFAIREGKNREVRNVMAHLGLEVNRLIRVSYGPFQLGELGEGEVEEVRSRLLRDQLGERITKASGADFKLPTRESLDGRDELDEPRRAEKPRRAAPVADRKGRRVLVERTGSSEGRDSDPRRSPKIPYKGKRDRKPRSED